MRAIHKQTGAPITMVFAFHLDKRRGPGYRMVDIEDYQSETFDMAYDEDGNEFDASEIECFDEDEKQ